MSSKCKWTIWYTAHQNRTEIMIAASMVFQNFKMHMVMTGVKCCLKNIHVLLYFHIRVCTSWSVWLCSLIIENNSSWVKYYLAIKGPCHLATISGTIILVPCHEIISLWLMKSRGARFAYGFQWLDSKRGHQDGSLSNRRQGDMFCWTIRNKVEYLLLSKYKHSILKKEQGLQCLPWMVLFVQA